MKQPELDEWEGIWRDQIANRTALGGYNQDASTLLLMCQFMYRVTQHLKQKTPERKSND